MPPYISDYLSRTSARLGYLTILVRAGKLAPCGAILGPRQCGKSALEPVRIARSQGITTGTSTARKSLSRVKIEHSSTWAKA